MPIGLADLFGSGEWVPTGARNSTNSTKTDFYNLVHGNGHPGRVNGAGNCHNILALIPAGTINAFEFEPRSQYGFKFVWCDLNGIRWQVHGHEPDAGAVQGHVGAGSWTVRICCNNEYLMSEEWRSDFPLGHANHLPSTFWKRDNNVWTRGRSHIVLVNP